MLDWFISVIENYEIMQLKDQGLCTQKANTIEGTAFRGGPQKCNCRSISHNHDRGKINIPHFSQKYGINRYQLYTLIWNMPVLVVELHKIDAVLCSFPSHFFVSFWICLFLEETWSPKCTEISIESTKKFKTLIYDPNDFLFRLQKS